MIGNVIIIVILVVVAFQVFFNKYQNTKRHKDITERLERIENSLKN